MLWQQFQAQCRVIHALIVREVISLYGRNGLGALWLAVEPLTFALPVLLLWHFVRTPQEHGIAMMSMLWTGYMPLLLFRHIGSRMLFFIRQNTSLLYHRNVTLLDIATARCLIEISQNFLASMIVFAVFFGAGVLDFPKQPGLLLIGYFFMVWWCVALGLIIGALSERVEILEKIWQPFSYTYIFYGGPWFLVDWLPPAWRSWALLQPSVQSFEMLRAGMLGNTVRTYYDFSYTALVLGGMTFLGLWKLREGRRMISVS